MKKVAIVYWSGTGNTEKMAYAISKGAASVGIEVIPVRVGDIDINEAADCDVLLLGCPAMGAEELEDSEFEPFYSQLELRLNGMRVGLFGSYGWGDGEWMRSWRDRTETAGAEVIGTVTACYEPDEEAETQCFELGVKAVS